MYERADDDACERTRRLRKESEGRRKTKVRPEAAGKRNERARAQPLKGGKAGPTGGCTDSTRPGETVPKGEDEKHPSIPERRPTPSRRMTQSGPRRQSKLKRKVHEGAYERATPTRWQQRRRQREHGGNEVGGDDGSCHVPNARNNEGDEDMGVRRARGIR